MKQLPSIFVSYCQKYTKLKDFFVTLLNDLGFRTEVFDYGAPNSVLDTEKELIETCDGFVALLTPDQEVADGRHICSEAVNFEISMAFHAGKPFQLFAFNNVDFAGIQASKATTVAKFSTLSPAEADSLDFDEVNIRQIFRALLQFKKRMDSVDVHKGEDAAFFKYKRVEIDQQIISPEALQLHNTVEAVALKNLDTHTHAARLLCDRGVGDGIEIKDGTLRFKLIRPKESNASVRITENSYSNFRFYIDFDPPVQAGTDLKYAYRRNHFNYFPYTLEDLEDLIADGKLNNRVMASNKMIGQDFIVTQPTDSLSLNLTFPAGYPIPQFKALVCEYRGDQVHHAETERVGELVQLDHDEFDDIYRLHLDIPRPHVYCSYFLLYKPPMHHDIQRK